MRCKNVIRHLPKDLLTSRFPKLLIAPDTALQQADVLRDNGDHQDELPKLFHGTVRRQAEHAGLAGPFAGAGDQEKPLF